MEKYIGRIILLFLGMILFTACPSEFDNRLEKNINYNMDNLFGEWDSKYHTLKIAPTLIKGNYFADVIMKDGGANHQHIMYITEINGKYYASLMQKGNYEDPENYIVEFQIIGNTLKAKMLSSTEITKGLSTKALASFIRTNQNNLTYNSEFCINYQKK